MTVELDNLQIQETPLANGAHSAAPPVLEMPELTMVTRYADCTQVLRQHDLFSVALYAPKQAGFWMSQDDTATHWREKSIMRALLDLEDLPKIREFVAAKAGERLQQANGRIEAVNNLTRAVPVDLVREFFNFDQSDPQQLIEGCQRAITRVDGGRPEAADQAALADLWLWEVLGRSLPRTRHQSLERVDRTGPQTARDEELVTDLGTAPGDHYSVLDDPQRGRSHLCR